MPKSKGRKKFPASPLEAHKQEGKVLRAPMNQIGGISLSSWVNEVLPEMLWSLLLLNSLPRKECLATFMTILDFVEGNKDAFDKKNLTHSSLAEIDEAKFDEMFSALCADKESGAALAQLLMIEGLPGRERWATLLANYKAEKWDPLAEAVAKSYDHQSESATDSRWLRVMTEIKKGKVHAVAEMQERLNDFIKYPDNDDFKKVGASVRAAEMMTRSGPMAEANKLWPTEFWSEMLRRTGCIPVNPDEEGEAVSHLDTAEVIHKVYEELIEHYGATIKTTDVDTRHEGSFGLAFYIIQLAFLAMKASVGQTIQGRLVLRSAVEALIILIYLAKKDDPTIWLQYRNYGAGQAKLALLKFKEQDAPSFVTRELLEELANADLWMEYQDIKLGAWADKNLRKMAAEADAKDLYDKYYDALSGYTHGNWAAVSHSTFGFCLNPLHRFHRIPLPPRFFIQDAAPDLVKLINHALDQVSMLYPTFKPRVRLVKAKPQPAN